MSRKGPFVKFVPMDRPRGQKTPRFAVASVASDLRIGEIRWYSPWRRFAFYPYPETIFDEACLYEIRFFIVERMAERKP